MKMKYFITILAVLFFYSSFCQTSLDLIAHYPFNGNANDSSGNGLHAAVNKGIPADDRYGRTNHAYKFVGDSNTYITVLHDSLFNISADKSVSLWYRIDTIPNQQFPGLIFKEAQNYFYPTFGIQLNQDAGYNTRNRFKVNFFFGKNTTNYLLSTNEAYNDYFNQWVHIVATYSYSSGYAKIYFNGVVSDSLMVGQVLSNASNHDLQIGRSTTYLNNSNNYFKGYLDDIRIYGRELRPTEIDSIYTTNDTASQDTSPALRIEKQNTFKNIIIYPNPAKYQVTVANLKVNASIKLYDIIGKQVLSNNISPDNNVINLEYLKKGIYTLKLYDNESTSYYRLAIE